MNYWSKSGISTVFVFKKVSRFTWLDTFLQLVRVGIDEEQLHTLCHNYSPTTSLLTNTHDPGDQSTAARKNQLQAQTRPEEHQPIG